MNKPNKILVPHQLHSTHSIIDDSSEELKQEFRREKCNELLAKYNFISPSFDVKCVRCGKVKSILNEIDRQIIITDEEGTILYVNKSIFVNSYV